MKPPKSPPPHGQPWPYPRWIAHRGAGRLAPENTLAAFRHGAAQDYRMFECDAKLSADDVPFLLHDATLERTTNGRGLAGHLPWSHLSTLDAGSWHSPAFSGEPLPSLAAIARFCLENNCLLNIEIKPTPGTEQRTGEGIAREAARLWKDAPVPPLLTSFQPDSLKGAKLAAPLLPRGLLLDAFKPGWLDTAQALGCVALVGKYPHWNAENMTRARDAGLRCLAYTVNDAAAAQGLLDMGIDSLITDRIDKFRP